MLALNILDFSNIRHLFDRVLSVCAELVLEGFPSNHFSPFRKVYDYPKVRTSKTRGLSIPASCFCSTSETPETSDVTSQLGHHAEDSILEKFSVETDSLRSFNRWRSPVLAK